MERFTKLLDDFEELNERKRSNPQGLTAEEKERWKVMRREIEKALFNQTVDPQNDSREFLRVPVSLSVRYWTRNELKDRYIPVLGEGGLAVSTIDPLPIGTQLDLEIVLAHKRFSFNVRGEVVWVKEEDDPANSAMGIRFMDLTYEQKRMVYGLVDDTLRERLLERRRFARVDARLQVKFLFADGFFELETEDISLDGMFIATDHLLPVGERIRLVLHIPGKRPAIRGLAEVIRVADEPADASPAGLGVRFVDLEEDDLATIRDYLGQRMVGVSDPDAYAEGLERRKQARMGRRIKLRFQSVNAFGMSYSKDISSGGVFIQTHENPPPLESEIEVTLVHPVTLRALVLPGTVVRVVEADPKCPSQVPGAGVAFGALSAEMLRELQNFLMYYVQQEHGLEEDEKEGDEKEGDEPEGDEPEGESAQGDER